MRNNISARSSLLILALWIFTSKAEAFVQKTRGGTLISAPLFSSDENLSDTKDVVSSVVVTGATGRTGKLVVNELLQRGVESVTAVVRDVAAAKETFAGAPTSLKIVQCDLTNVKQIKKVLKDVDAVIWCATGFSNQDGKSPLDKLKSLFQLATKQSIDLVGLPAIGEYFADKMSTTANGEDPLPKVVLLSSAGVTRTIWTEEQTQMMPGAADIPIVRLNPFGILDIKRESEEKLRATGVEYCIFRPAGLNDNHPAGSRVVISQGDVAVGRINRADVARTLVDILSTPEATGKTCEAVAVAGYAPPNSIRPTFSKLYSDQDIPLSSQVVQATYNVMQQLLPGEKQDAAALAMGQTYEQLDEGVTGRLGERGSEDARSAAPKPSS